MKFKTWVIIGLLMGLLALTATGVLANPCDWGDPCWQYFWGHCMYIC